MDTEGSSYGIVADTILIKGIHFCYLYSIHWKSQNQYTEFVLNINIHRDILSYRLSASITAHITHYFRSNKFSNYLEMKKNDSINCEVFNGNFFAFQETKTHILFTFVCVYFLLYITVVSYVVGLQQMNSISVYHTIHVCCVSQ